MYYMPELKAALTRQLGAKGVPSLMGLAKLVEPHIRPTQIRKDKAVYKGPGGLRLVLVTNYRQIEDALHREIEEFGRRRGFIWARPVPGPREVAAELIAATGVAVPEVGWTPTYRTLNSVYNWVIKRYEETPSRSRWFRKTVHRGQGLSAKTAGKTPQKGQPILEALRKPTLIASSARTSVRGPVYVFSIEWNLDQEAPHWKFVEFGTRGVMRVTRQRVPRPSIRPEHLRDPTKYPEASPQKEALIYPRRAPTLFLQPEYEGKPAKPCKAVRPQEPAFFFSRLFIGLERLGLRYLEEGAKRIFWGALLNFGRRVSIPPGKARRGLAR